MPNRMPDLNHLEIALYLLNSIKSSEKRIDADCIASRFMRLHAFNSIDQEGMYMAIAIAKRYGEYSKQTALEAERVPLPLRETIDVLVATV